MFTEDGMYYEIVDMKLSNGLELKGCRYSGGSYETEESVGATDLAGGLRRVEITHTESGEVEELNNVWLEGYAGRPEGGSRFSIRELGYYEREELKLKANVEYLAMMMGVEL